MKLPEEILDFMITYTGDPPEQIEIEFERYWDKIIEKTNNPRFHRAIDAHTPSYFMFSQCEWSKK